jgi:hypothetical protein
MIPGCVKKRTRQGEERQYNLTLTLWVSMAEKLNPAITVEHFKL